MKKSFFSYNAIKVWIEDSKIFVQLDNGKKASLFISQFPLLAKATPPQLNNFQIVDGYALHWPELGEDLSIAGFFENKEQEVTASSHSLK